MLRSRVDTSRIVLTPKERAELLRLGAAMDHEIDGLMHVVVPETYKNWLRQLRGLKPSRKSGRHSELLADENLIGDLYIINLKEKVARCGEFPRDVAQGISPATPQYWTVFSSGVLSAGSRPEPTKMVSFCPS